VILLLIYLTIAGLAGAVALLRPVQLPRAWPLLALAALPQALTIAGVRHSALALLSLAFCLAWCWENRGLPGAALLSAGLCMNLLVMAAHGGAMPVRTDQLAALGVDVAHGTALAGSKDTAVDASALWWLGDWLSVQKPPFAIVASPGDLLVVAGLARWLLARRPTPRSTPDDLPRHEQPAGALPPAAPGA